MRFQFVRLQIDGTDQVPARLRRAIHRPIRAARQWAGSMELHRLHHLADVAIRQHEDGIAVAVGQIEGVVGEIGHLLHGVGREHQRAIAAVSAALHHLVIIALLGRDVAQAGSAAHDVRDHAGQFRTGDIADALLHEADPRPAGCGHGADTGRRSPIQHVDCGHFALRLHEGAARRRHVERGGFGDFARRGDRVAVESPASGQNGALDDGFVALGNLFSHRILLTPRAARR